MNASYQLTKPDLVWRWERIAARAHADLERMLVDIWRDWQRATPIVGQRP